MAGAIKAKNQDYNEPYYIKADHGSYWKHLGNPLRKKTIQINIEPKNLDGLGIIVHLTASLSGKWRKTILAKVQKNWGTKLFSQLWTALDKTKPADLLWHLKVTQFLITLPEVKKESDFKRLTRKVCNKNKEEQLTEDQVLQMTEALKLQLLTAKVFAPSKKEKILKVVDDISKSILAEALSLE